MIRLEVAQRSETKEELFRSRLKTVVSFLEENHIDYRVLGSLACEAFLKKPDFNPCRQGGSFRDIDLILEENTPKETIEHLSSLCCPIKMCLGLNQYLHFNKEGEGYIQFWQRKITLDKKVLEPYRVSLLGVDFNTLSPRSLFHMPAIYEKPSEDHFLRKKDVQNMLSLGRLIRKTDGLEALCGKEFKPFHECLKKSFNKELPYFYINWLLDFYRKLPMSLRVKVPREIIEKTKNKIYVIGGALGKGMEKRNMLE